MWTAVSAGGDQHAVHHRCSHSPASVPASTAAPASAAGETASHISQSWHTCKQASGLCAFYLFILLQEITRVLDMDCFQFFDVMSILEDGEYLPESKVHRIALHAWLCVSERKIGCYSEFSFMIKGFCPNPNIK